MRRKRKLRSTPVRRKVGKFYQRGMIGDTKGRVHLCLTVGDKSEGRFFSLFAPWGHLGYWDEMYQFNIAEINEWERQQWFKALFGKQNETKYW
jgi:hypothetical protein